MAYETQYARLATNEKLSDRFLNTQLKSSSDLSKAGMGQVFTLVEILTPWFPTAQIGQTIINTFISEYYNGGSTSDLVNFEEALKKVNETLAKITQNGETDWIGNVNAILGVIVENKIHIAQVGKAEGYIFRDGKTNHLTYGLTQNGSEPHPLKTFSNITSGELKPHDKILFANPEAYKHFNTESFQQIVSINSPAEAVMQIAKILKKKKVSAVNVLVVNFLDQEEFSRLPTTTENNTIYLDRPLESFWAGGKRAWRQIIFPILKVLGKTGKKAGEKSLDFTRKYLKNLQERKKTSEPIKKRDLFEKEFIDSNREDNLLKDEEIKYSPELDVHYYQENKQKENNKLGKLFTGISGTFKRISTAIVNFYKNRKTRPYFLIVLAIVLLVIVGLVVSSKGKSNKNNINLAQAQVTLREAEQAQSEAKTAILSNDQEKGKTLFLQAIEKAKSIQDVAVVGPDAKNLINQSYQELDKLTATTRLSNLEPIFSAEDNIKAVFVINGQAYLVTQNEIYKGLLSGGKIEKTASIPRNGGDFLFGTAFGKDVFLYTSSQKIYDFQTASEEIDIAEGTTSWETANAASNYIGNIYLLDGIIGQIYKHPSSNRVFSEGEPYINSPSIDIKNSISLAVDGSIYVLKSNGETIKLQMGKLQDFSLKDIPTPNPTIEKPQKIYTDSDTSSIYVLDGGSKRIIEFDKEGHFLHQYALPDNFSEVTDFYVSYKSKKIWLTSGKGLYEISI